MFLSELNSGSPQPPYEVEAEPKQTNELRLFKGLGNVAEFGAYFSGGLLMAIACRLIPKMLVFYLLLKVTAVGYLWLSHSDAEPHIKKSLRLTGLAITISSIAGYWDAILLFLTTLTVWHWIAISAVLVAFTWVLIELKRYARGQ